MKRTEQQHKTWPRRPATILAAVLALGAGLTSIPGAEAQPSRERRPMPSVSPRVDIVVHGSARPTHWADGQRFVEGRIGERYVVRIHNPTWRRVEAVVSVDGRDVIDGRPASLHKRGYVITPHGYVDIDGFRLSNHAVASFRFSSVEDSYAARMGTPWRVGTIDVALFPERVQRRELPGPRDTESSRRSKGDHARPSASGLGTEFGEQRVSPVRETRFEREDWNHPAWRVTLGYDDADGLCSLGVRVMCPSPPPPPYYDPRPYAEPPPGWYGYRYERW